MPPRRSKKSAGSAGNKNRTSKSTTVSVEQSGESSSAPLAGPAKTSFEIPSATGKPIKCEQYTPQRALSSKAKDASTPGFIFTHGAGGGLANPATSCFAIGAANVEPSLVFEGAPNLVARTKQFQTVLQHILDTQSKDAAAAAARSSPALGGRSLGARAAVQTANARNAEAPAKASPSSLPCKTLVLVSYPLTSPSGDMRDAILCEIHQDVDVLFVSGDRDSMCDLEQLNGVRQRMRAHSWLAVVQGADHGMAVKPASATEARRKATGALAARWLVSRDRNRTELMLVGTETEEWTPADDAAQGKQAKKRKAEPTVEKVKKVKKSK